MTEHEAPRVVAHRGASAAKAEHTLAAYELALQEGADGLECDVRPRRIRTAKVSRFVRLATR